MEEPYEPTESSAVDLATISTVIAAFHLLTAGVTLAVAVGVGVIAGGGDCFGVDIVTNCANQF